MVAEVNDLASDLQGIPNKLLRQGVVSAVAADSCSVKWGNSTEAAPLQKCLKGYSPKVNDVVWGIRDANVTVVLGPVGAADALVLPTWITVGSGGGAPAFVNSWVQESDRNLSFCKDSIGFVHLRGKCRSGTINSTVFTLPTGYRPLQTEDFPGVCGTQGGITQICQIKVTTAGLVQVYNAGGSPSWVTMGGVLFIGDGS